ncbi:MAG: hypothetical protein B7Y37_08855 [Sphingobacteriia bacterium 28-36-52]|nr:MAG: hypothetical protein B7Y37_08855 [Sphingobacteriia bacterium 28-36-52]
MSFKDTYIQYGVPSEMAEYYSELGISVSTFKSTSNKHLIEKYKISKENVVFIKECLKREAIDESIIQSLLENNRYTCCLCKGEKGDGFIIHHIVEYSITQDNSYSNLAVLCPNDHDICHRKGFSLTNSITEKQLRAAKRSWEKQVKYEDSKLAKKAPFRIKKSNLKDIQPFKELKSYSESDEDFYFGRTSEIEKIEFSLSKYKILGLFGESGTGKTSIINAGIIPLLKRKGFIIVSIRCLDEPISRIRYELFKVLKEIKEFNSLIDELIIEDSFHRLLIKLNSFLQQFKFNLLICIDQFEELFTRARVEEREKLAKGIIECIASTSIIGKLSFLLSLREDYIGELWDWSHKYNLEDAWIHQYRLKRLEKDVAIEVVTRPLSLLGISFDKGFVDKIIEELMIIGDGQIYPPYLQIVCSELFEQFRSQKLSDKQDVVFDSKLVNDSLSVEAIIGDYLSESMLINLTQEEKILAHGILDLLTGSEGLRAFLRIEDISRYLSISEESALHIIGHLVQKKIVHPVVENDTITGYELVHDFLSKRFFEKLGDESKKTKTVLDIFRKAFREWKQHLVLASKDRLDIFYHNYNQLSLNHEEWEFIIKSSFSVYWYFENKWINKLQFSILRDICLELIKDSDDRIVENAIRTLCKNNDITNTPLLIGIIESTEYSDVVKEVAINQFAFYLVDIRILETLKKVIKTAKNYKLRKSAIYAFGKNVKELQSLDDKIIDTEIKVVLEALNDSITNVRKEAATVLSVFLVSKLSLMPLLDRLKIETSVNSRKAIVTALVNMYRKNIGKKPIFDTLMKIINDKSEDYRVVQEAKSIASE